MIIKNFEDLEQGSVVHLVHGDPELIYIKLAETKCVFIYLNGTLEIYFDEDQQGFWSQKRTVAYVTALSEDLTTKLIETFKDKL